MRYDKTKKDFKTKKVIVPKKKLKRVKKQTYLKSFFKWFFIISLFLSFVLAIIVFFIVAFYSRDIPNIDEIANKDLRPSITIKSSDGTVLAKYGDFKGDTLTYSQIPTVMINALLAAEDRRFFDHSGVDFWGILRAQYVNFRAGKVLQGGSTITQQLAKIIYLSPERTLKRKIQEFVIALQLEKRFSKEQILAMYLNRVYLGKGNYGIDAAARFYFGKKAEDLTIFESAIIAGMLKAPTRYAPSQNLELSVNRALYVVGRMFENGYISKVEFLNAKPPAIVQRGVARGVLKNPYFTDYILNEVHELFEEINEDFDVYTTLDLSAQKTLEETIEKDFKGAKEKFNASQVSAIVMEPSGAIKAMMGGISYNDSQYNRAVASKRQPGSAFKIFVYTAAVENGIQLYDTFEDKPLSIFQGNKLPMWQPKNFTNKYLGTMSMEYAFANSINTVTVQISEAIGRTKVINIAHRLGVTSTIKNLPSLALGVSEVSLLEMTQGLAHIINNGSRTNAFGILKIVNNSNKILYQHPGFSNEVVLNYDTTEKVKTLLSEVIDNGTGKKARLTNKIVYGKTGTSQDHRDAWFIGSTDHLVMGVWIGNDDNTPMKRLTGGMLPAQIWHNFMINVGDIDETKLPKNPSNHAIPLKEKSLFDVIFSDDN